MRQIYNTAESPEMAIFQLMDMVSSVSSGEMTQAPSQTGNLHPKLESASGQSSCKNPSRLSLANLLPSRLEINLNFIYDFIAIFIILLISCQPHKCLFLL